MADVTPTIKRRSDYQAPDFSIDKISLTFHLHDAKTQVDATMQVRRNGQHARPLILDGEELQLQAIRLNDQEFDGYQQDESTLTLNQVPDNFELYLRTTIDPLHNTSLEGLYMSEDAFCTQCEAEGFRRITYYLDRPDVLAEFDVTIHANKARFPYLLSNGNLIGKGEAEDGTHWVKWHDPFKKPSYLFALVAGDFDLLTDSYTTQSGKAVSLELYVDKGKKHRGGHALTSLKKAMRWDEQTFGLEYDLEIYMIVAVDFFNMGAMENKGLNIFNSKFVLADSETATDEDYFNIESVIAHEYFHNWTGNRVTCRDWFQLSLKEGLTVFRDQQFSADMSSRVSNRIRNVKIIREHQFAEDASAMSHPIRPDEVMEMNNFYTVTVYDKGAEVIRMMHTLLGEHGFAKGMKLYFTRHDGQAVTCDDFVAAMEDATGEDLAQFRRWYGQSGTPLVKVRQQFDRDAKTYTLTFEQHNRPTADQIEKQDLLIPINLEVISAQGQTLPISHEHRGAYLYRLTNSTQQITLPDVAEKPVPVILGDFSAPVKTEVDYLPHELALIARHGHDEFARWDAMQQLYSIHIHQQAGHEAFLEQPPVDLSLLDELASQFISSLTSSDTLGVELLTLPSFETLCQQVERYQVTALFDARKSLMSHLASQHNDEWLQVYQRIPALDYEYDIAQVEQRRLKNLALTYLALDDKTKQVPVEQFNAADNMTDTLGALKAAQSGELSFFDRLMEQFEGKWREEPLVLDKWFSMHASTAREDILARLQLLAGHKQYTIANPNRVRALVGTFAFYNPLGFHAADGSGYEYVTDYLMQLDEVNPQVSARIVTPLTQWQHLDKARQEQMRHQLARLANKPDLSKDLTEKVSKSLGYHLT